MLGKTRGKFFRQSNPLSGKGVSGENRRRGTSLREPNFLKEITPIKRERFMPMLVKHENYKGTREKHRRIPYFSHVYCLIMYVCKKEVRVCVYVCAYVLHMSVCCTGVSYVCVYMCVHFLPPCNN